MSDDDESLVRITPRERLELAALEAELDRSRDATRKDRLHVLAAVGFTVAGASAALGLGAGVLGVAFVAGLVTGMYALAKGT